MILKTGNMWEESKADAILFTANSTVRADGALVMGRGAALEAQKLYPGINKKFGGIITILSDSHTVLYRDCYGVILLPRHEGKFVGAFQVKRNYKDDADPWLIDYSVGYLSLLAGRLMPGLNYAVNFPGIGWGRLKREDVLPIIGKLPDNIEVWESCKS